MDIDGETKIFGVVGDPIKQVKTPTHINSIFQLRGSNTVCMPFHVTSGAFEDFWHGMKACQNIIGFGITVPHKKAAMQLCDTLSPRARKIGVVNVVRRQIDGTFHGDIFDGVSFVAGLKAEGFDPKGHKIYMYGAGGAATAIGFALAGSGVESITIQNRTRQHADDLALLISEQSGFKQIETTDNFVDTATMIINASCLGMNENDPLPVDPSLLNSSQIIAEVVAKPEVTKFLRAAEEIGCPVHSGIHMITNQMNIMADFVEGKMSLESNIE